MVKQFCLAELQTAHPRMPSNTQTIASISSRIADRFQTMPISESLCIRPE